MVTAEGNNDRRRVVDARMANVLVTGSTSGVGRYLVERLAARGDTVLAHGRDKVVLDALVAELGPSVHPYLADLASLHEVRRLAEQVTADHDRLDVLVNNAGVGSGEPGAG